MSIYNNTANATNTITPDGWQPVTSSVMTAVRYNPEMRTLDIKFVSGRVYRYSNISQGLFDELMKAESKGRWFNTTLRLFAPAYPGVELAPSAANSTSNSLSEVSVLRLSHAFNLEGKLFTLSLPVDGGGDGEQVLVLQSTRYYTEPTVLQPVRATHPTLAALVAFEQTEEEVEEVEGEPSPTAVCLYTLAGERFTTLSVRVSGSENLPQGVFYAKSYAENTSLFLVLVKHGVLLPVEGYPAAPVGYAGVVHTYRLNPDLFYPTNPISAVG